MKLKNKKRERFCQEYVKDHNGTLAYKRAGYVVKGKGSARSNAARMIANDSVKKRIKELEAEIRKRNDIETDEIIDGYKKIITVCSNTYKIKRGQKNVDVMVDAKNTKGALDSLARIEGKFNDKVEVGGKIKVVINYADKE